MTAADRSAERVVTDWAVEVHVTDPDRHITAVLTQTEARAYADDLDPADPFADEIRDLARDADWCRCGHRLAGWGDLCSVCVEANEPAPDAA